MAHRRPCGCLARDAEVRVADFLEALAPLHVNTAMTLRREGRFALEGEVAVPLPPVQMMPSSWS